METTSVNTKNTSHEFLKKGMYVGLLSLTSYSTFAQTAVAAATEPVKKTIFSNPMFIGLISVVILMLIVILIFADVAKAAIRNKAEQEKKKREMGSMGMKIFVALLTVGTFSSSLIAQTPAPTAATSVAVVATPKSEGFWGLDAVTFFSLISIIAFEILVAWRLYAVAMQQLGVAQRRKLAAEARKKEKVKGPNFLERMNASVAIEEEDDILLDHNYDGIQELDNNLPPWWKYGFYMTILFGIGYLIHFHVTHTGKLQIAEYNEQIAVAKREMEEYRKKAANLVDENNATLLTDAGSLASGKTTFKTNCVACHGENGEGGVGPNLTDDFWLHQGDIKDVFKTIKYGYPEKGMKSWEQDLGAKQIHEVASYVKSLHGTKPANAKAPEGELYTEKVSDKNSKDKDTIQKAK
jgi:cytochrome c oxidase cbb3-type subunit 3